MMVFKIRLFAVLKKGFRMFCYMWELSFLGGFHFLELFLSFAFPEVHVKM